jgi:hypothetical protein
VNSWNQHPIELSTLAGSFAGDASAVYPQMMFVASVKWNWATWITLIEFSTSLTVFPSAPVDLPGDLGGMAIVMGKSDQLLAIGQGLSSSIVHLTAPNSIAGPPSFALPSSKVSPIAFGGCGFELDANTPISLYAFARVNASGNFLNGVASIQYRRRD